MWRIILTVSLFCGATHLTDAACRDGNVGIISPWMFVDDASCQDVVSSTVNLYDEGFRQECQRWLGQAEPPRRLDDILIGACYEYTDNTTVRYKAELCCPGEVTENRCFTCLNSTAQYDKLARVWETYDCNYFGEVETCADDQTCMSTFERMEVEDKDREVYKTVKKCEAVATCEALASTNGDTCRSVLENSVCTYCCDTPFCNLEDRPARFITEICLNNQLQCSGPLAGVCVEDPRDIRGYTCTCLPGSWGEECSFSQCDLDVCKNDAICERTKDGPFYYECSCQAGWNGQNCSSAYPTCATNLCENGGSCFDHGQYGQRCRCTTGFLGELCELQRPFPCPNPDLIVIPPRERIINDINAYTCTTLDAYVDEDRDFFLRHCTSRYKKQFRQGIDGFAEVPYSIHLHTCLRGDYNIRYLYEICCPACLSNPCENDGWCAQTLDGYRCQCRHGYEGTNCQHKMAMCMVSGDPHYKTFDGKMVHFEGGCRYQLAASLNNEGLPDFAVYGQNEQRHGLETVTFPDVIEIHVYNHVIRMQRDHVVMLDGQLQNLPFTLPGINVVKTGNFIRLETDFTLIVEYDGFWIAMVKVPPTFVSHLEGICGDFNYHSDNDLITRQGVDVTGMDNGHYDIGVSWQVDEPGTVCTSNMITEHPVCEESFVTEMNTSLDYCSLLHDTNSLLGACVQDPLGMVSDYLYNCLHDTCANKGSVVHMKEAACGSLAAFAENCKMLGHIGQWRQDAACDLECPAGMVYLAEGTACPPTCEDPLAHTYCHMPDTEGCFCPEGQLLQDGLCVEASACPAEACPAGTRYMVGATGCPATCDTPEDPATCALPAFDGCVCLEGSVLHEDACILVTECPVVIPACPTGMFFQTDATACPATCENPDAPAQCQLASQEECACPDGTLLHEGGCVEPTACPVVCPEGMEHQTAGTGCPATCDDPEATISCQEPAVDGCFCLDGTLLHEGACIAADSCPLKEEPEPVCSEPTAETCFLNGEERETIPGYKTLYRLVGDTESEVKQCQAGTSFSVGVCVCEKDDMVIQPAAPPSDPKEALTCVTFDEDYSPWGFSTANWIWVQPSRVSVATDGCVVGRCGFFDGSAHMQIPYLANAFSGYSQFSVSMWHRRVGGFGPMGLINNGVCAGPGSVHLTSLDPTTCQGSVQTDATDHAVHGQVDPDAWRHLVMSYDGQMLNMYVNQVLHSQTVVTGPLMTSSCPLTIGHQFPNDFFSGYMDEICFYDTALTPDHIKDIYDDQCTGLQPPAEDTKVPDDASAKSGSKRHASSGSQSMDDAMPVEDPASSVLP